jgi:hypothetical protein
MLARTRVNWSPTRKLLRSVVGKDPAHILITQWKHWEKYKGAEWTTHRIKAIWNIANLYREGNFEEVVRVAGDARIALRGGVPKGMEGTLVKAYAQSRKPSVTRRYAACLRSYTAITLPSLTKTQLRKSKGSITSYPTGYFQTRSPEGGYLLLDPWNQGELVERLVSMGWTAPEELISQSRCGNRRPRLHTRVDPNPEWVKRMLILPPITQLSGSSVFPGDIRIPSKRKRGVPYLSMVGSLVTRGAVPQALLDSVLEDPTPLWDSGVVDLEGNRAVSSIKEFRRWAEMNQRTNQVPYWGKISVIQEQGGKGRIVCSPNAWVQLYAYPYHVVLARTIQVMEKHQHEDLETGYFGRSCMWDQPFGLPPILDAVKSRSFAQAIDLSSATDRFPLQLQQTLLDQMGLGYFADALEDLKGPYLGPDGEDWWYRTGQPMGLYGSFPLFHLSHFTVLDCLCRWLCLPMGKTHYVVLGDDVVVFDPLLALTYRACLSWLGVPVSEAKCYQGSVIEFAGFMVTTSSSGAQAFRPYKAREDGGFSSVLNVLHALGAKANWSPWWREQLRIYWETLPGRNLDLSPNKWYYQEDDDAVFLNCSPGPRMVGACLNEVSRYDDYAAPKCDWSSFRKDWYAETILCRYKEPFPGAFSDERLVDQTTFVPENYLKVENARKHAFVNSWSMDPLVSQNRSTGTPG